MLQSGTRHAYKRNLEEMHAGAAIYDSKASLLALSTAVAASAMYR